MPRPTGRPQLRRLLADIGAGDVLMVTRLDRLAEFERELICARTGEGRERAMARGQSLADPSS